MTILDKIVAKKREQVEASKRSVTLAQLKSMVAAIPPPRDFATSLRRTDEIRLLAEVKKASPSAGVIRADFDPVDIAQIYEANGAAAISVLTDEPFFQGKLSYLRSVRQSVMVPVLRKDFILEPYQVYEAREAGADAVLLIAEILSTAAIEDCLGACGELGMAALVELFEPENIERVLASGARIIGVNNRNLRTFETRLEHTLEVAEKLSGEHILVSESGIRSRADVLLLREQGVDAILVGEALMRSPEIATKVRELLGR